MIKDKFQEVEQRMTQFLLQSEIKEDIQKAVAEKKRYNIDLDALRKFDDVCAKAIFEYPEKCILLLEKKLNEMMNEFGDDTNNEKLRAQNDSSTFPTRVEKTSVDFKGNFGRHYITPRGLKANMLNKLVRVQGIVTRMSTVSPKLTKSYHTVEATGQGVVRNYQDDYSLSESTGATHSTKFPTHDAAGNVLTHDYGYCEYKKMQKLVVQELPERAPPGQLPRSITVILEGDLVDQVKPGDRVETTGVYKSVPGQRSQTSAVFQTIIFGTGIQSMVAKKEDNKLDALDIASIKKLSKRTDLFEVLANSVAPSIYGHHSVKKGILLQLLGGVQKKVEGSGTRIRGDINMLLVGDPSTAKSQLLRQVMEIAPLAINTTGRGSSGVGLTAAVQIDKDTGERHLEAGAMVLADKGVVCIDEFDKMNSADRVAIHEVMEQQTVTISKAGIHASLNARCSVIAAANPIYGDYDTNESAAKNIGLPDSLLSRFDLLFVVLDDKDPNVNSKIAERVILNHRFKKEGNKSALNIYQDDVLVEQEIEETEEERRKIYENDFTTMVDGSEPTPSDDVLNRAFLKKYLSYAKSTINPVMDEDAVEFLSNSYSLLRAKGEDPDQTKERKLPITARTLETLIRLATAHAKLRLSQTVTSEDMQTALMLLNFSIFTHDDNDVMRELLPQKEKEDEKEEAKQPRQGKRAKTSDKGGNLEVNMAAARKRKNEQKEALHKENTRPNTRHYANNLSSKEQVDMVLGEAMGGGEIDEAKLANGKKAIHKTLVQLKKDHPLAHSYTMDEIYNEMKGNRTSSRLTGVIQREEVKDIVKTLEDENIVMLIEGGCILL